MKGNFKFDPTQFYGATRQLANLAKKKPVQDVMRGAAGQVIKRVVGVTPPSKGTADNASKKRGEAAIDVDLRKLMAPAAKRIKRELDDPEQLHADSRDARTGRVNPRSRKVRSAVERAKYNALRKRLFALVGHLAAGWNAAAQELGVSLPAWIKRHGTRHGIIKVTVRPNGIRIYLANAVGFVDNIPDLERRLQWALDTVAKSIIEKQIPQAIKSVAKRAGFKAR